MGPLVSEANPLASSCRNTQRCWFFSSRSAIQNAPKDTRMKKASEMSVNMSRAISANSMPVAITSAERNPAVGESRRRPKIQVPNTSSVANSADGKRAANSVSPKTFCATIVCQ